jgi:hypothetical protein
LPIPLRAIVATALALGLMLVLAASAWAAPVVSIDSGPSGPTRETQPVFEFTVDETATNVDCSIDQGTPFYLPCSETYTPLVPLSEGDYTFRVRASDGVEEAIRTRDFTVDLTRPSLSIDSGPSGPTNDTAPSFGFRAGGDATAVECSIDQGTPAYAPCTSPHAPAAPLAEGSYTFRVRATDAAGNEANDSQGFSVDTTPPSLSIDSAPPDPTNDRTPSFGFTVAGATTVECSIDQGTPTWESCTSPYTAAPLPDGRHTFRVRASDASGNEASASQDVTVDTTPPSLSIDSGPAGPTSDTTPSFGFTVGGDATVVECSIDRGAETYVPCDSPYSAGPLPDGRYTFRVRAADALGNSVTLTQSFSVDREAPSLSIDSGPAGPTNDATPSFAFTTDASRVECSVDLRAYGPCTTATTHLVGALPDGRHTFRVRATDGVGNQAVEMRSFTVDTVPPSLAIAFGPSGTTSDSTPLFGFSAESGATLECSIDRGPPAYGPCASATTHAASAPLSDGAYVFRVRATDAAGNQTSVTRAFTVSTGAQTPGGEPTPPTAPPPTPSKPQLLSPFPLVRISGTLTPTGARIRLLSVRAPRGALVRVSVRPGCSGGRRSSRRCRVLRVAGTVGRRGVIRFRGLARQYRSGTVIVVRVWRDDLIGKYTRFTIMRGKAPRRVDQCLVPGATRGSRCPSA